LLHSINSSIDIMTFGITEKILKKEINSRNNSSFEKHQTISYRINLF
jgi:hypothetical protein